MLLNQSTLCGVWPGVLAHHGTTEGMGAGVVGSSLGISWPPSLTPVEPLAMAFSVH